MTFAIFRKDATTALLRASEWLAGRILEEARANVSGRFLHRRTGDLHRSLRSGVDLNFDFRPVTYLELSGPGEKYGRIWEETGVRRHFVAPRRAKALHWYNGRHYFSKGHWIPAQAKRPFMRPAVEKHLPAARRRYEDALLNPIERLFTRTIRLVRRAA